MNDREIALSFVNRVREKHGHEPIENLLPGKKGSSCDCSIAKSLQHEGFVRARVPSGSMANNSPIVEIGFGKPAYFETSEEIQGVLAFIRNFDYGHYPDLVAV